MLGVALALGLTVSACSKSDTNDTEAATAETTVAAEAEATEAPAEATEAPATEAAATEAAPATEPAAAPAAAAGEITVAIVDNPTMKDIQTLTPDNFTKQTGIKVNYVSLNEQTLREQVTKSVGAGAGHTTSS